MLEDQKTSEKYYLAKERLSFLYSEKNKDDYKILKELKGHELAGQSYEPLFSYFKEAKEEGALKVLLADFVTTSDGTGIVHQALPTVKTTFLPARKQVFHL